MTTLQCPSAGPVAVSDAGFWVVLASCARVGVDILAGEAEEWNERGSGWVDRSKVDVRSNGDGRGLGAAEVVKVRAEVLMSLGKRVGLRSIQR